MSSMLHRGVLGVSRSFHRASVPRRAAARPVARNTPSPSLRRHVQSGTPFRPLMPPSPGELGAPKAAKQYKKSRKWGRRLVVLAAAGGLVWVVDTRMFGAGITRSFRTFSVGLLIALDYKINFRPDPWFPGTVLDLHVRNAQRLFDLLQTNGGLYMKMGQAIAMQSAILPPEFGKMFEKMFDDAPQDDWKDVETIIKQDFGKSAQEVFGVSFTGEDGKGLLDTRAKASASVAQVHWARLPDGREVAIKVQKLEVARQRDWDLWAFRVMSWAYSKWFDLPFNKMVPYVSARLQEELDFLNEAHNAEEMKRLVESDRKFKDKVYIPTVYHDLTTSRVLTCEWIEGAGLWDKDIITGRWLGGRGKGSPGVVGGLPPIDMDKARQTLRNPQSGQESLKPDRSEWRGPRGKGGLGLSTKEVMTILVDLFSAQIFSWGVVHCDPHPGNMFVRRLPSGKAQLVLIDHGLYSRLTPEFRHQYATFWKAIMTLDNRTIEKVVRGWGIHSMDFFASMTLMRPYEGGADEEASDDPEGDKAKKRAMTREERAFHQHQKITRGIQDMLRSTDKWPLDLIFIFRQMRIVQGNNQFMGSPVNRIKIMGEWASKSLYLDRDLPWRERLRNAGRHVLFKTVMFATDLAFYFYRIRQWLGRSYGMEDAMENAMEQQMADMASDMGIELQREAFKG